MLLKRIGKFFLRNDCLSRFIETMFEYYIADTGHNYTYFGGPKWEA